MATYRLLMLALLTVAGCAPRNVPPDQAKVVLSNARTERKNGEDVFFVDYKFTRGRPDRGRLYRLNLVSGSDQAYWIDVYWNERQLSGTIDAKMSFRDAEYEPSKYFEAQLIVMMGAANTEPATISNKITFGTPTAEDVIGGDGEPDPPPRSQQPQIAQTPPSGTPNVPVGPPVGIGPRFPRGAPQAGTPFGSLDAGPGGAPRAPSATPFTPPPNAATVPSVSGKDTLLVGGKGGVPFRVGDKEGRVALGFRYAAGSWAGQPALRTFDPLYERTTAPRGGEVVAREGYAVGGLKVNAGEYVQAVQVVFYRLRADGRLDPADTYASDWLGTRTDKEPASLDGGGAPVRGIHGRRGAILDAIGLVLEP